MKKSLSKQLQPQLKHMIKQIKHVRRERGGNAQGDGLLWCSVDYLSNGNHGDAKKLLLSFCNTPDLRNDHRVIIQTACSDLRPEWLKKLFTLPVIWKKITSAVPFILRLYKAVEWVHRRIHPLIFFFNKNNDHTLYDTKFKFNHGRVSLQNIKYSI